jgi:hypothetical protein
VIVPGGLGGFTIAIGADGLFVDGLPAAPNVLASTVTNWVAPPVMLVIVIAGLDVVALKVPAVMAIRTSCSAGAGKIDPRAFWCGFHSDGSNQASN